MQDVEEFGFADPLAQVAPISGIALNGAAGKRGALWKPLHREGVPSP